MISQYKITFLTKSKADDYLSFAAERVEKFTFKENQHEKQKHNVPINSTCFGIHINSTTRKIFV